jgi:predicted PurR-regulated permease PerM
MKQPLLYKATLLFLFAFLLIGGLHFASEFLIPLSFALLLSMLMLPVAKFLERIGCSRGISSFICLLFIIVILSGIIFILSYQIIGFAENFSLMKSTCIKKFDHFQNFIEQKFHYSSEKQIFFFKDRIAKMAESADGFAKSFVMGTTGTISSLLLVFICIFFFMLYREKFKTFMFKIVPIESHLKTRAIIEETSHLTQQYITGVSIVILILSVLNSIGLMLVGVPNAIFFGCLAAMLIIIPYIGTLIGSSFPILFSLLTQTSSNSAIGAICVFAFTHLLESNFLTPNIVGSKIKINPLATIMALVVGGFLWGIAGMILFIPFLGILKIIFDKIETLQPYGYLIGDESKPEPTTLEKIKKRFSSKKKPVTTASKNTPPA